jgi:hypothetical protein
MSEELDIVDEKEIHIIESPSVGVSLTGGDGGVK